MASLATSADAKRVAHPAEKASILLTLKRSSGSDWRPECWKSFFVSTVDARYARVDWNGRQCDGNGSVLLMRSGSRWSQRALASEWWCSDPRGTAPRAVIKDLFGGCVSTQHSDRFVTPSGNIACEYVPGPYDSTFQSNGPGELRCYVGSTRTLVTLADIGATNTILRRGVAAPASLRQLRAPVLEYGSTWKAPYWIKCVSRSTALQCVGGRGAGFTADRSGAKVLG
jgi:hypothetical protein